MLPQLKKEDLKIGMRVQLNQLADIYNTYILLSDTKMVADDNGLPSIVEGVIEFIGMEQTKEFDEIRKRNKIMVVINTPYDGYLGG